MTNQEEQSLTDSQHNLPVTNVLEEELTTDSPLSTRRRLLIRMVQVCLVVSLLLGILGGYFFFPFAFKLTGTWQTADDEFKLVSQNKQFTISQPHTSEVGLTYEYRGTWQMAGANKYIGQNMQVWLKIDKMMYSKEQLAEIKKENVSYVIEKETKKKLYLSYQPKSVANMFKGTKLANNFRLTLLHPHNIGGKEVLEWNSPVLAPEMIYLKR